MINPSSITEGGIVYSLGSFDGKKVDYDFPKVLVLYLTAKGKLLFGEDFKIYRKDNQTLRKLCTYYVKDKDGCKKYNIDPNKGLLLSGTVGCGKTSFVRLMRHLDHTSDGTRLFPVEILYSDSSTLVIKLLKIMGVPNPSVSMTLESNLWEDFTKIIVMS